MESKVISRGQVQTQTAGEPYTDRCRYVDWYGIGFVWNRSLRPVQELTSNVVRHFIFDAPLKRYVPTSGPCNVSVTVDYVQSVPFRCLEQRLT